MLGKLNSFIQRNQIGLLYHTIYKKLNQNVLKKLNHQIPGRKHNMLFILRLNILGDLSSQVRATKQK